MSQFSSEAQAVRLEEKEVLGTEGEGATTRASTTGKTRSSRGSGRR